MLREHNATRLGLDFRLARELLGSDPRWLVSSRIGAGVSFCSLVRFCVLRVVMDYGVQLYATWSCKCSCACSRSCSLEYSHANMFLYAPGHVFKVLFSVKVSASTSVFQLVCVRGSKCFCCPLLYSSMYCVGSVCVLIYHMFTSAPWSTSVCVRQSECWLQWSR